MNFAGNREIDEDRNQATRTDASNALDALMRGLGEGRLMFEESLHLNRELVKIAVGRSDLAPAKGDRRFADRAWTTNPIYRRVQQIYLASVDAVEEVVDRWGRKMNPRHAQELAFVTDVLVNALAPTNSLLNNPAALKEAFDTAGMSLLRGFRNYLSDLRRNGGMPRMVEPDAFAVGVDLAVTPGRVVSRDEVAEVLQYVPTTETVFERPVLVVPPPIGRFYFLDLRPGRSFVEYSVSQGLRAFMMSWRNPQPQHGDWNLNTYAQRVSDAIDEVREITGCDEVNVIGFCAGGIITTALLNHLAAHGDTRVHSMSYAVTMLDFEHRAQLAAFSAPSLLRFAKGRSRRKGIITAREMGSAFTWMRPNDLVFNYVVNNYLMGRKPPAFDILAWNADGTNLPGALHAQFLDIFADNSLVQPTAMTALGTPIELSRITVPTFVSGAVADHLTPWKNCYRTTQLLSGESTFVLSSSGHIAALVNPPGNPDACYWEGAEPGPDPDAWLETATSRQGSWWEPWAAWVTQRAGQRIPASRQMGSSRNQILGDAPGLYARDLEPANNQ
jgi:poly[(R)-3-hydroxyalkanoate] polymerase subunit PhaC